MINLIQNIEDSIKQEIEAIKPNQILPVKLIKSIIYKYFEIEIDNYGNFKEIGNRCKNLLQEAGIDKIKDKVINRLENHIDDMVNEAKEYHAKEVERVTNSIRHTIVSSLKDKLQDRIREEIQEGLNNNEKMHELKLLLGLQNKDINITVGNYGEFKVTLVDQT